MKRLRTIALAGAATTAALIALAGPASAHVTVSAPGATRGGGDQEITFRVPVEKNLDTIGVTIQLPTDTPIASVLVEPLPGWTHTQTMAKLAKPIVTDDGEISTAVSEIHWTAAKGRGLRPGEYGAFTIIAGQLPDTAAVTFKALQAYSDGTVVAWIETAAPGSKTAPEHPAPVLTLAAPASGSSLSRSPSTAPTTTKAGAPAAKAASNTAPVVLAIIALVVATAALGLVVVSRARTTKSS